MFADLRSARPSSARNSITALPSGRSSSSGISTTGLQAPLTSRCVGRRAERPLLPRRTCTPTITNDTPATCTSTPTRAYKLLLFTVRGFAIVNVTRSVSASDLATYARLREAGRRLAPPAQTIRTVKLYHRQVYEYAYHRPKLALLAESAEHARFTGSLASFLEAVPKTCPHDLFTASVRASQTAAA